MARRFFDVPVFLLVGTVCVAEPEPQGRCEFSARPSVAARAAVRPRRRNFNAADALSELSADSERSKRCGVLAALAGIAVLAVRTDVVLVALAGRGLCRCWRVPVCTGTAQPPEAPLFSRRGASRGVLRRVFACLRARLCAVGAYLHAVGLVPAGPIRVPAEPSAALCPLFLCRRRARRRRRRTRPPRGRRAAGASMGHVGRCRTGFIIGLDGAYRAHDGKRLAFRWVCGFWPI